MDTKIIALPQEEAHNQNNAIERYLERRTNAEGEDKAGEPQERLEYISPKSINLDRGSQTRVSKNEKGTKDFLEKMKAGLWRFDDPKDCPLIIELTEDCLVEPEDDEDKKPFWVYAGERIPATGHTRLESGTRLQAVRPDIKFLVRIKPGTWFDVIRESGISDVNSAYPKSDKDRSNAARRFMKLLFKRYGSLDAIPRRGKGKAGIDLKVEYGSKTLSEMFGVSTKTIDRIYANLEFNRTLSDYPDGTRVQLVAKASDPTLPWYLKTKIGALGIVSGTVPNEGLFVRFDLFNPESVPVKFLQKSDAPLPETPLPEQPIAITNGGGSSGRRVLNKSELKKAAASQGLRTGSQPLPSLPTNRDISPEEAAAEPPTPSPLPNTENKSEESTPLQQNTSTTTDTTTGEWIPELLEWVQIKADAPHDDAGSIAQITCFPHSYSKDLVIVEIQGKTGRDRIETKYLQPVHQEVEEAPKVISTQDIIQEITIGVRQLSPEELSQILVQAQPTEAHKKAIKAALFSDSDANLVEAARTVADNIGLYSLEELEKLERAINSVKSAQAN